MNVFERKRKHVKPTNIKYEDDIIRRAINLIDNHGYTYLQAAEVLEANEQGLRFAIIRYKRDNPEYTDILKLLFSTKWSKSC